MGGLDDLLPDDADTSGRSSSRSKSTSSDTEYAKEFSSKKGTKKFTEEKWEKMRDEINRKFKYTANEVESLPAEKRHDVLHEAAKSVEADKAPDELEYGTDVTCAVCEADCSYDYIELHGEEFCYHHPLIQVANELGIETQSIDHEKD